MYTVDAVACGGRSTTYEGSHVSDVTRAVNHVLHSGVSCSTRWTVEVRVCAAGGGGGPNSVHEHCTGCCL